MQRVRAADRERLHSFDLNLLRVFDALLVTRSVSAAAERLQLSQPATSAALARLRKDLGDPLLVRNGNRMRATAVAEELRPRVARILEDIGDALGSAVEFDPATTQRRFRVGANDYTALVLLAPLALHFQASAPLATLEVMPIDRSPVSGLANRELDLIIADRWYARDAGNLETLFHETFVSIARVDHPQLSRRPTLGEFLKVGHALISAQGIMPGVVDDALEALGQTRRIALTIPHYLVAPAIISRTDLVMTVPTRLAAHCVDTQRLRQFSPPLELEGFDVVMASHARSQTDAAIRWLMQSVRVIAADIGKTS